MREKNVKKVILLLEELDTLTVDLVVDKLNISKIEAESIFKFLIVNEYVLNLSNKIGLEISANKYVDYKSLSKGLKNKTTNRANKKIRIIKWIGWTIMIVASLLAIRWYILN
jgi:hypothetical protein